MEIISTSQYYRVFWIGLANLVIPKLILDWTIYCDTDNPSVYFISFSKSYPGAAFNKDNYVNRRKRLLKGCDHPIVITGTTNPDGIICRFEVSSFERFKYILNKAFPKTDFIWKY